MRVFVTGGTGLLGNNIVRQLLERGDKCLALVRRQPPVEVFDGLDVELVIGDLDNDQAIEQGVAECDVIIHSAALIHLGWKRQEESLRVNQLGTRRIVDAALRHGKRMIHIGTVNTLGVSTRNKIADEQSPLDLGGGQVLCNYVASKRASVDEVRRGVQQGLSAAIVHPGFMLGPWDWKPSSGRMIVELARGWMPLYPIGGCSVCDPRDVAAGVIAAVQSGGDNGCEYILAGENWTYKKLWSELLVRLGKHPPHLPIGPILRFAVGSISDVIAAVSKTEGDINSAAVKMSAQYHWYDSSRARAVLGYQTRPPEQSIDDAIAFVLQHHLR